MAAASAAHGAGPGGRTKNQARDAANRSQTRLLLGAGLGAVVAAAAGLAVLPPDWQELWPFSLWELGAPAQSDPVLAKLGLSSVLVLRLKRSPARIESLLRSAAALDLPLEILDASDGIENKSFRSQVLPLTMPESTCGDVIGAIFDSHERAWGIAAAARLPTLVLEDDTLLPADFADVFPQRLRALPRRWHMGLAGSSVTPKAKRLTKFVSQPDADDVNGQAVLGFWAYVVSPAGAQQLLHLARMARAGRRRLFQPVDLFVGHRLRQLNVYVLEAPDLLAREFEREPDVDHVLMTMRQVGVVTLVKSNSTNRPVDDEEAAKVSKHAKKVVELGKAGKFAPAWAAARKALKAMRHYGCWHAATLLQNTGRTLLDLLDSTSDFPSPNATLLAALEALASAVRYGSGTHLERQRSHDFSSWVRFALSKRSQKGLPPVAPPGGWGVRVPLPGGGWLVPALPLELVERLPAGAAMVTSAEARAGIFS